MTKAVLGIVALLCAGPALARPGKGKTILDYYLSQAIEDRLPPRPEPGTDRRADIRGQDVRAGYLRLHLGLAESAEMKLFHLSDGTPLLALAKTGCCCEGTCVRSILFLADRGGELVDVTKTVWTDPSVEDKRRSVERRLPPGEQWMANHIADTAAYRLPRTTAAVFVQEGSRVYMRFRLKGDKFVRY